MKKLIALGATISLVAMASTAQAQFGGLKAPGMGGGNSDGANSAAGEVDGYLARSIETAQMMSIAIITLDAAAKQKLEDAGTKAALAAVRNTSDPKELGSKNTALQSSFDASKEDNFTAAIEESYKKGSAKQKAAITAALFNMAIAIPRAVTLAKEGPDLIKGLGTSPANLGKVGKLKAAVSLFSFQVGATGKFAGKLPGLMSAVKAKAPADPKTAKGQTIDL